MYCGDYLEEVHSYFNIAVIMTVIHLGNKLLK